MPDDMGRTQVAMRLLLVDDSDIFLDALSQLLRRQPTLEIAGTARSGIEAVMAAPALRPDVILLDLAMPGMSGLEAIPPLRAALPNTRIIVLTLLDSDSYESAVLKAGADAFLAKSTINQTLLPTLRAFHPCPQLNSSATDDSR